MFGKDYQENQIQIIIKSNPNELREKAILQAVVRYVQSTKRFKKERYGM